MRTFTLILWVFAAKTGAPHFSYVKNLPDKAACEETAKDVVKDSPTLHWRCNEVVK